MSSGILSSGRMCTTSTMLEEDSGSLGSAEIPYPEKTVFALDLQKRPVNLARIQISVGSQNYKPHSS